MIDNKKRRKGLSDHCQYVKGVGPARAQRLLKLGVETINDLLTHFPRKYYDRRNLLKIGQLQPGVDASFLGQVLSAGHRGGRRRGGMVTAAVGDDTGIIQVVWFNQPYIIKHLKPGTELIITGELGHYRGARQIVNPEFEVLGEALDQALLHTGRIVPVYPLTSGVTQRYLRELISRTLDEYADSVRENLPSAIFETKRVCSRLDALRAIHFPESREQFNEGVSRLKLEELFYLQLTLSLQRRSRRDSGNRPAFNIDFSLEKAFLSELPFDLTGAQKKVLAAIHADVRTPKGMHRLLQGDVGSGKTIVAGATLLAAVEAGYQAALMVPTEILAVQHAKTLSAYFDSLGIRTALLIGSLKAGEKRALHAEIADGSIQVVIGTHALIQDNVRYDCLGVVVIDEQHRFGVRQRAALLGKNGNPHMLVMTATPIPRTLALTAYADLDLSVIDELPPGRAEVKTRIVTSDKREAMYEFIAGQVTAGPQAYLLYPVIEETEKADLEAAVSAFDELKKGVLRDVPVGLVHGRMSFAEKDAVMRQFATGDIKILVATTVVEVGVHVPAATIMVIHHPERFGLSQLHQLRGRVGRGGREGYCFLVPLDNVSHIARDRLQIMTRISDGFKIAEEDLRIRGPGEFFGVRQHGVPGLKIANPAIDQRIVEFAQAHVKKLLDSDPHLEKPVSRPCRDFLTHLGIASDERAIG